MGELIVKTNTHKIKLVTNSCEKFENIVVCFHGFNGNKWGDAFDKIKDKLTGSLVCSFDSAGHGKSEVESIDMTLEIVLNEIDAVVNFLSTKFPEKPIVFVAVSYGAYRVLAYLKKYNSKIFKSILVNPAIKMIDVLERVKGFKYSDLKDDDTVVMKASKNKFISKKFLDDLYSFDLHNKTGFEGEILIVVGERDSLIPREDVLNFANKNNIQVMFVDDEHCMENEESWQVVLDKIGGDE